MAIPRRALTLFVACLSLVLVASCQGSNEQPFVKLQAAVDGMVVETATAAGTKYTEAAKVVDEASSPQAIRFLAQHLGDTRPTLLLQGLERTDGEPFVYTIGDALHHILKLKCLRKRPERKMIFPDYMEDRQRFVDWMKANYFDLEKMRIALERDPTFKP